MARSVPVQTNNDIDLLLVGGTGRGKSSVGNSILGRPAFFEGDSGESFTEVVQVALGKRFGRNIRIVDVLGVGYTRVDRGKAARLVVDSVRRGVGNSRHGFKALLLVLKYGDRFTEEEVHVVSFLKSVFGENFTRNWCILVFTHGENFDMANERRPEAITFKEWCLQQQGELQVLLQECHHRVVLFYNSDEENNIPQLTNLFRILDSLSEGRYTQEIFNSFEREREALVGRETALVHRDRLRNSIDNLQGRLENLRQSEDPDEFQRKCKELRLEAMRLEADIDLNNRDDVFIDFLRVVRTIRYAIQTEQNWPQTE